MNRQKKSEKWMQMNQATNQNANLMRMHPGMPNPEANFVRMYRDMPPYVNNHADAVMRTLG